MMPFDGSNLFNGPGASALLKGPLVQYAQRPASGTNLPHTLFNNAIARAQTPATHVEYAGQQAAPQLPKPATTHPAFGDNPAFNPAAGSGPSFTESHPKPDLERFVPFTGVNGGSTAGDQQGPLAGLFGGSPLAGGGAPGAGGNPPSMFGSGGGDYRTLLARLIPAFRGQGPMANLTNDYFSGPVQPSFSDQFSYLQ